MIRLTADPITFWHTFTEDSVAMKRGVESSPADLAVATERLKKQ